MQVGRGGKKGSACMSGLKGHPSGKAILQNKASQYPVHQTSPDKRNAHFIVAGVPLAPLSMEP